MTNFQRDLSNMTTEQLVFVKNAIQDAALAETLGGSWKETLLSKRTDKLSTPKVKRLLESLSNVSGECKNDAIRAFLEVVPKMKFKQTAIVRGIRA